MGAVVSGWGIETPCALLGWPHPAPLRVAAARDPTPPRHQPASPPKAGPKREGPRERSQVQPQTGGGKVL